MITEFYLLSDTDKLIVSKFLTCSFSKGELVFINDTLYSISKIIHDLDHNKKIIILNG